MIYFFKGDDLSRIGCDPEKDIDFKAKTIELLDLEQ